MLLSLISEGVFQKFPKLKVVMVESGFTWLPGFLWRADKTWRGVRREVPWVTESPSTLVRRHVRFTLQPDNAPPEDGMLERVLEHIGSDDILLFSTDYPHWHYDAQDALPKGFPKRLRAEASCRQSVGHLFPAALSAGRCRQGDRAMNVAVRDPRPTRPRRRGSASSIATFTRR